MGKKDIERLTERIEDSLQRFHPFQRGKNYDVWHDQIKGFLFLLGVLNYLTPIPEYPVSSPHPRGGIGRIDMVWLGKNIGGNDVPIAAFEIDNIFKMGSLEKLEVFDSPLKFAVSGGSSAGEEKLMGSPRIAGKNIRHIVVTTTTDSEAMIHSAIDAIGRSIGLSVERILGKNAVLEDYLNR
jgi:hypothetical protein